MAKPGLHPGETNDQSGQIRPLLDDLLRAEWLFDAREATNGSPEYALAVRLAADRARLWQNNLATVAQAWTQLSPEKISEGWQLRKQLPPNSIRFVHAGDWIVFSCAQNEIPLSDEMLRTIRAAKRPLPVANNYWLSVQADWPRLAKYFPALAPFDFPKIGVQVIGANGNLQLDGKFYLAQPLPPLENWRLPTNVIHPPLVSFTAARGVAPWLEQQSWFRQFDVPPAPGQLFVWALPQIPFQTFVAQPVPDGRAALAQLDAKLVGVFNTNSPNQFFHQIKMEMTSNHIAFTGLPFFSPFVEAKHEPAGDFLYGGFFPNLPRPQPLPQQLLSRLNQSNLVYYHWENSADRLKELPQLSQLLLMVTEHRQLDTQSAAGKWLDRLQPALGSSVTEVIQSAPRELTFVRTSPGGLTALELLALANWLEASNFPGCDLKLPPRKPLNFNVRIRKFPARHPLQRPVRRDRFNCIDSCSNSASTLTTSPRFARRGIAGAASASLIRWSPPFFAKRLDVTASPRICARTGGTSRTATFGNCAKSSRRG